MVNNFGQLLFAVGVCFLLALLVGKYFAKIQVPKVTGYLFIGLLVGPSLSHLLGYPALISTDLLKYGGIISDVGLAFIMLTIGSQFKFQALRRLGKRLAAISFGEITFSFLFVALTIFFYNQLVHKLSIHYSMGILHSSLYLAIFTGLIAIAGAPAASLMVIREYESEGSLTDIILALIGLNNVVVIILFNIISYLFFTTNETFGNFLLMLIGPVIVGFITGLLMSVWAQKLENPIEHLLLICGGMVINIGLCWIWQLDIFLSAFVTGLIIVNASPREMLLFKALKTVDYPLYVFFFVVAGASLHVETLMEIGFLGLIYIVMRTAGKMFGCWFGNLLVEHRNNSDSFPGYALIAQAGVAIGLAQSLAETWPEGGLIIQTVILGSVVFFELAGPITLRHALVQAGEVPLLTLLARRAREGTFEGLHNVIEQFRISIGVPAGHNLQSAADIHVKYVMRKNVETICEDTPFNEILHRLSQSRYDRFPVVNKQRQFIGVLDYSDIRDILFDETMAKFVVASDLVKPEPLALQPDQTLGEVLEIFESNTDVTYLPIVDPVNSAKLLGIISQNDVLAAFRKTKTVS